MVWPLVIAGYLLPALLGAFALRPAGDLLSRWGRNVGSAGTC